MTNRPSRGAGSIISLCLGGAIVGGLLGLVVASFAFRDSLRHNPDPQAQAFAKLFTPVETCFTFVFVIFGAGIGAMVGGATGAVLVGRAAARERSALPAESQSGSAEESPEEEVARLRAKIERLKDRIDDIEEGDQPPAGR